MEFKDIITNTLESNGFLNHIRAQLRGEIYESIKNDGYYLDECKQLTDNDLIIAQIFKDFLEKSNAEHTLKSYIKEANLTDDNHILDDTLKKIGIDSNKESPILYEIITKFKQKHIG